MKGWLCGVGLVSGSVSVLYGLGYAVGLVGTVNPTTAAEMLFMGQAASTSGLISAYCSVAWKVYGTHGYHLAFTWPLWGPFWLAHRLPRWFYAASVKSAPHIARSMRETGQMMLPPQEGS